MDTPALSHCTVSREQAQPKSREPADRIGENNDVDALTRHGPARPGHLARHGAGSDGPDEPGHDERGRSRVDLFAGWYNTIGLAMFAGMACDRPPKTSDLAPTTPARLDATTNRPELAWTERFGEQRGSVMTNTKRRCGLAAAVGFLAIGLAGGVAAMPTCEGTYATESLKPLPARIVVGLDIHDPSPEHLRLADRFLAGLREAGVAVGPQPNVLLSISSSRLDTSSDQQGGGAQPSYPGFSGLQGGIQLSLPAIPETHLTAPASPPPPPELLFRVEATEAQAARSSWVANVRCQMVGTDDGARAQDLGRVIGGALGRRIDRGPL
jgi:hypothetical protein